jgi:hypothetical protein
MRYWGPTDLGSKGGWRPMDGQPAHHPQSLEFALSRSAGTTGIADSPPLASFTDP